MPASSAACLTLLALMAACGGRASSIDAATGTSDDAPSGPDDASPGALRLPPANGGLDYQLGTAYPPPAGVEILSRDRRAAIAPGLYNICYLNGFQAQPDENEFWLSEHPDLVLRDADGKPVIDAEWDEMLLDIRSADKRAAIAAIVGGWIGTCASDGFDAIEIDNLDSYSRSQGRIGQEHAVSFMRLLADAAHASGLPIGQKNSTEILSQRAAMGTDFAIAEECARYSECGDYVAEYGDQVYVIEYRRQDFDAACENFPNLSIVLRDKLLVAPGEAAYVFDGC